MIQLHVAVLLAGFTAILGKLIELGEAMLVWYRLLITVLTLAIMMSVTNSFQCIRVKDFLRICGVGLIIAFHWLTFYGSVKYANVSVAVVCLAAAGFFSSLFEPVIFRRRIQWPEVLLGLLAITGIYIIFDFHPQYKLGIIFGILAALGSALFPIFNKQLISTFDARILTFYELTGGFLLLSLAMPFYLKYFPSPAYVPALSDFLWLLMLSWICTILCFDLQLSALKHISAFTSILAYNLEPVYGIILGFLIFKENKSLNYHFYLGLILIIMAVMLQTRRVVRKKSHQT